MMKPDTKKPVGDQHERGYKCYPTPQLNDQRSVVPAFLSSWSAKMSRLPSLTRAYREEISRCDCQRKLAKRLPETFVCQIPEPKKRSSVRPVRRCEIRACKSKPVRSSRGFLVQQNQESNKCPEPTVQQPELAEKPFEQNQESNNCPEPIVHQIPDPKERSSVGPLPRCGQYENDTYDMPEPTVHHLKPVEKQVYHCRKYTNLLKPIVNLIPGPKERSSVGPHRGCEITTFDIPEPTIQQPELAGRLFQPNQESTRLSEPTVHQIPDPKERPSVGPLRRCSQCEGTTCDLPESTVQPPEPAGRSFQPCQECTRLSDPTVRRCSRRDDMYDPPKSTIRERTPEDDGSRADVYTRTRTIKVQQNYIGSGHPRQTRQRHSDRASAPIDDYLNDQANAKTVAPGRRRYVNIDEDADVSMPEHWRRMLAERSSLGLPRPRSVDSSADCGSRDVLADDSGSSWSVGLDDSLVPSSTPTRCPMAACVNRDRAPTRRCSSRER